MQPLLTLPLNSGKKLHIDIDSIKNYLDSCEGKIPEEMSQAAINALTDLFKVVSKKNPLMAKHIMGVALSVFSSLEVV